MHGLINRSIQSFVIDTYGDAVWRDVLAVGAPDVSGFEAMLSYDDALTFSVLAALTERLRTTRATTLEDLGTYLVSHPNSESLRRLLRFGGITFGEFLHSLEDLPERARLAVSDLALPSLIVNERGAGHFVIRCDASLPGFATVLIGLLRGMADDYGVLVLLEQGPTAEGAEEITVRVLDETFAAGRQFDLVAQQA